MVLALIVIVLLVVAVATVAYLLVQARREI
jgi:hypothetical protein